jgi:hypothetical protein
MICSFAFCLLALYRFEAPSHRGEIQILSEGNLRSNRFSSGLSDEKRGKKRARRDLFYRKLSHELEVHQIYCNHKSDIINICLVVWMCLSLKSSRRAEAALNVENKIVKHHETIKLQ